MHAVLKACSFCSVKYHIQMWLPQLQISQTSLQYRMEVLCVSAMALSAGNDFNNCHGRFQLLPGRASS